MSDPLPHSGVPFGWVMVGGKRLPVMIESSWAKALGERTGRGAALADERATASVAVVQANAMALQAAIEQGIANAAALLANNNVLIAASIPGAGTIPTPDDGSLIPPIEPGTDIP